MNKITRIRNGQQLDGNLLSNGDLVYLQNEAGVVIFGKKANGDYYGSAFKKRAAVATATVAGDGTGVLSIHNDHVTVTSSASTKICTLPAPEVGKQMVIDVGANGFKLQTSAPATIGINGGTGASAVSAIAANSTLFLTCVSLTSWKGYFLDADSDVAKIPAAA